MKRKKVLESSSSRQNSLTCNFITIILNIRLKWEKKTSKERDNNYNTHKLLLNYAHYDMWMFMNQNNENMWIKIVWEVEKWG